MDEIACSGIDIYPEVGDIILEDRGYTYINDFNAEDPNDTEPTDVLYFKVFEVNMDENWILARALNPGSTTDEYIEHTYPRDDSEGRLSRILWCNFGADRMETIDLMDRLDNFHPQA